MTHATDCPTIEKKEEGDVRLGRGPVIHRGPNMNHKVVERLIQTADEHKIAYQLAASAKATGTDANAIQINRAGVATGLISIPNRYMHSPVEMISLDDIDRAADLLARFAEGLDAEAEFTPYAEVGWNKRSGVPPTWIVQTSWWKLRCRLSRSTEG